MKKNLITLLTLMSISAVGLAQSWPVPTQQAKAGARWWWLGSALDKENVSWNMKQYAEHGIGALEITPLYGVKGNEKNNIDYLSPKWMDMLKFVMEEGKRNGIQIDMNNGTGWPFGGPTTSIEDAAGMAVFVDTIANEKDLRNLVFSFPEKKKKSLAAYSRLDKVMAFPVDVKKYNDAAIDVTSFVNDAKLSWKAPKKGSWRIIALYDSRTRQQVKRAAPGGQGYVIDHFDKNAVSRYLQRFDKVFAETSTPWPNTMFNDSYEVYDADWTPTLPAEFQKRRGYSLYENLDKLLDADLKVVADYRETLSDMLLENFTNQWTSWAHSHGMITRNQAHGSPANLIDIYAAVDIPEIEGFGLSELGIKGLRTDPGKTKINDSDFSMLKYAPSAAHITGKNLISSETFTWLTEHFRTSLSQMKPDLDLMFVAGVNHVYFHGICYSPKNDPWPGWKFYASVDMSPTNSIWRDAPSLMQYIERCQSFLQWGKPDNDFLVYFPIHDLWQRNPKNKLMQLAIHNMGKLAPDFRDAILELDRLGFDCDYISDKYLLTTSFDGKQLKTEAGIGYKGIVIPANAILTDDVKAKIELLKSQGTKVIYGNDKAALDKAARPETMRTALSLKTIRRKNDNGYHYFIANLTPNDVDESVPVTVAYESAMWFNPMTGERFIAEIEDGKVRVNLRSGESMILETFNTTPSELVSEKNLKNKKDGSEITIDKGWTLSFMEEAPKVEGVFNIDNLRTWETLNNDSAKITMGTGVYETEFAVPSTKKIEKVKGRKKTVSSVPADVSAKWAIDLGDVRESARVYINNVYVGCAWAVPYVLTFDASVLNSGKNTLRIEVTNLPANRIADYDRRGVEWRKFDEINVVDIRYKKDKYDTWDPMPSGLASSSVKIYALE